MSERTIIAASLVVLWDTHADISPNRKAYIFSTFNEAREFWSMNEERFYLDAPVEKIRFNSKKTMFDWINTNLIGETK